MPQGVREGRESTEAFAKVSARPHPAIHPSLSARGSVHNGRFPQDLADPRTNPEAFAKLVREHSDLVYRVAFRLVGPDDAQDAAQEVWVRVWRKIDGFRGESSFPTWLHRIAFNTCLSTRNRRARLASLEMASVPEFLLGLPGMVDDPEIEAVREEWAEEIASALLRIREEHRDAIVLRHMQGLSYAEIARVLGVPQGTAKGWASRGRAELLVALGPHGKRPLDSLT